MAETVFLVYVVVVLLFTIYRNVILYKSGKYKPEFFAVNREVAPQKYMVLVSLSILAGTIFLIKSIAHIHIMLYIFVVYSIALMVCISILNYLMYMRLKERKILFKTIVFDAVICIGTVLVWKYTMMI